MSFKYIVIFFILVKIIFAYKVYQLQDLCKTNPIKILLEYIDVKSAVHLDIDGSNSAALIQQSWDSSTYRRFRGCTFKVVVNKYSDTQKRGLYVTIKRLKLRKSTISGECFDYISFEHSNQLKSSPICGEFELSHENNDQMPFFSDDQGFLTVKIVFDTHRPLRNIEDSLDIALVFTAYEECSTSTYEQLMCTPGHCISRELKNDGLINCPPLFCLDEESCAQNTPTANSINGKNIAISAITSLIFTMFGVGVCIWICWKYSSCRNRSSQSNDSTRRTPPRTEPNFQTIELPSSSDHRRVQPTAPDIDDKDLPPTYESLFQKDIITH